MVNKAHHNQRYETFELELISMRFLPLEYLEEILGRKKNAIATKRASIERFSYTKDEMCDLLDMPDSEICPMLNIRKSTIYYVRKFLCNNNHNTCENICNEEEEVECTISMSKSIADAVFDKAKELSQKECRIIDFAEVIERALDKYLGEL